MPNMSLNTIIAFGKNSDTLGLIEYLGFDNNGFDFQKISPHPTNYSPNMKSDLPREPDHWLNWASQNWGTKWNAEDVSTSTHEFSDCTFHLINFACPYSPPHPIITKLGNKFPNLSFLVDSFMEPYSFGIYLLNKHHHNGITLIESEYQLDDEFEPSPIHLNELDSRIMPLNFSHALDLCEHANAYKYWLSKNKVDFKY